MGYVGTGHVEGNIAGVVRGGTDEVGADGVGDETGAGGANDDV